VARMWYYERQIALSLLNKGPVPGTGTGVLYCIRYSNIQYACRFFSKKVLSDFKL
jgi:hypothetical protein